MVHILARFFVPSTILNFIYFYTRFILWAIAIALYLLSDWKVCRYDWTLTAFKGVALHPRWEESAAELACVYRIDEEAFTEGL